MDKIKTAKSLTNYIRLQLLERGIVEKTLECIKTSNSIIIFYAIGNKLHKDVIKNDVIYTLDESDIKDSIEHIAQTILNW